MDTQADSVIDVTQIVQEGKIPENRSMVFDVMAMENGDSNIDRVTHHMADCVLNEDEETKEGIMMIIRANIKRITEEANKIDYDRLKRSQIQHFNRYGCFSC